MEKNSEEKEKNEEKENSEKKDKHLFEKIYFSFVFIVIVIAIIAVPVGKKISNNKTYRQGIALAEAGNYDEAAELLTPYVRDTGSKYPAAHSYYSLCYAHTYYDYNDMYSAKKCAEEINIDNISEEKRDEVRRFISQVENKYNEFEREKQREYLEQIKTGVPFEGMEEKYIADTTLGAPASKGPYGYKYIGDKACPVTRYFFERKSDKATIFLAFCVNGEVTQVNDLRSNPMVPYKPKKNKSKKSSTTTTTEDPYNVNDYSNEEDFYDDHYDDFFDYYEAEEYYWDHHE
ncbi:MAG: hypothetical protein ACI4GA_04690 [Acutalibacteraceae bacterium]